MNKLRELIHQPIPVERIEDMPAEALIEHVSLRMYNPEVASLRERETLERINALQDYEIMSGIRRISVKYGMTAQQLRDNVNLQAPCEISQLAEL